MADKLPGRGQSISRPAFCLLRKNPTVNCLGTKGKYPKLYTAAHKSETPTRMDVRSLDI